MSSFTPVYISNFQKGFDTYDQPEVLPNDGFPILQDALCFRGVINKRDGYELLASIPQLTITNVTLIGLTTIQITTSTPHLLTTGQQVMITGIVGNLIAQQINNTIFPYNVTVIDPTNFQVQFPFTGGVYTSGGIVCQPTMGLETRISNAFFYDIIAFTETQAYIFLGGAWSNISGATTWTGLDFNFFWSANYFGSFWATNNVDPIRYYITGTTWPDFTPQIDLAGNTLQKALMIFPYKNRLVVLSTTENGLNFFQRARWSQNGTPYVTAPTPTGVAFDATSWREDIVGKGGFIDAPTSEKIVTAGFVRDTLVVEFEFSTWRLRYNSNPALPFVWERINSQLGSSGTNSGVTFDYGMMSVGRTGIILADTNSCKRFDDHTIPTQVFDMDVENNNNSRIQGIRDYQKQLVYWTYVNSENSNQVHYPNKVLVYNYLDSNWAIFNQSFTVYGEYRQIKDLTWAQDLNQWQNENRQWNSGNLQIGNITVVAGDRFGNVFLLTPDINDDNTAAFNFNITTKKFNPFIQQGLQCKAIYFYLLVSATAAGQFTLEHYIDENSSTPIETIVIPTNTPSDQEKVWRRAQLSGTSQYHQFTLTFSPAQFTDARIPFEDYDFFQMIFEFAPAGRLNYGDFTT